MPMVLRSRRSNRVELEPTPRRRSTRPHLNRHYEDADESEPEAIPSQVMERREAELEEEAAEETDQRELKGCRVVLDPLHIDERTQRKEIEEKEDMNRKGGKPVSRIPTYQKRPGSGGQAAERMGGGSQGAERPGNGGQAAERMGNGSQVTERPGSGGQTAERQGGGSQTTDPPSPRKDGPVHVAQSSVRAGSVSVETLKSKPPEVGELALPPPSVRVPSFIMPSMSSNAEQAAAADHTSAIAAPKTKSISESTQGVMIASPRPPLRPEQDKNKHSKTKVGSTPEGLLSSLLQESVLSQKPDEKHPGMTLSACGDTEKSEEKADVAVVEQTECIMEEEPPWEPVKATESQSSRSSSDADLATERSDGNDSENVEEHQEPLKSQTKLPDSEVEEPCMDDSTSYVEPKKAASEKTTQSTKRSMCFAVSLFLLLLVGGLGLHVWFYGLPTSVAQLAAQLELHRLEGVGLVPEHCSSDCRVQLVESIPVGLYPSSSSPGPSIADSWLRLLDEADSSVHIAAFYFTLRDSDVQSANPSDFRGRKVFEQLKKLESRGVKLQIAVNAPQTSTQDTAELSAAGAQVRGVNLSAVTGGIVHTKLWVVDQKHFYLGSANMDWRSLSQVKEVGLSVEDCSCLAQDAFRLFGVYWAIGGAQSGSLPPFWPARLSALSSADQPLDLNFNGVPAQVYLSSAPPPISARGRSDDLSTILSVIDDARRFIHISVMDYLPLSQYTEPVQFWPAIDSRLRAAACTRGVEVRLMVSCWEHSPASMFIFLQSLLVLSRAPLQCNIDVKIFTVPSTEEQMKIPFARVNHAKYMVTDRVLYIGTSNWSQNYFTHTAGVGLVVNQTSPAVKEGQQTLPSQAEQLFLRDWDSDYASQLRVDDLDVCPHRRGFVQQ
ncbi:phospholipase D3 isoform X1 [Xiphophorus hellerii]|uniref:phospholipase D3 isoform X1 n=1 Tax=Xiphophorus hellerii TaxID=8084 RepID=UPI0013B44A2A|nr:phospholipase D3-like isoform X1 [Xiphophorus hellerii]